MTGRLNRTLKIGVRSIVLIFMFMAPIVTEIGRQLNAIVAIPDEPSMSRRDQRVSESGSPCSRQAKASTFVLSLQRRGSCAWFVMVNMTWKRLRFWKFLGTRQT